MPTTANNNKKPARQQTPIDDRYGHLLPQALDLEKVVLGALMIDTEAFGVIAEILHPETFYDSRHQKIFNAISTLNLNERPVDFMTVVEELKRLGHLDEVGGAPYIVELSSLVVSSAHIEYHAQILAQKYLARELISFASRVETNAFDDTVEVEHLMQQTEADLFELSQKNIKQDYTIISPVVKLAVALLQEAAKNRGGLSGIPTGYKKLDKLTSGWQKSDLVIIGGRPAMGKTSLALSIARNVAVDYQIPTAFFSLEMNNVQLVNRLISNVCEIPGNKMLNGDLSDDEWHRLSSSLNKLSDAPIYIDDTPGLSVFELRTKARRLVREKGVKIIMIDYLQLMTANVKTSNRQEEVSIISRSLKGLAKELDVPILALSQVNRNVDKGEGAEGKRPQLSDLRESGSIEQDADMVLFVHRPEYYHIYQDDKGNDLRGKAELIIAKHRKGETGIIYLRFLNELTRFQDPEIGGGRAPSANREVPGETSVVYTSKLGSEEDNIPDASMLANLQPMDNPEAPF